MRALLPLAAVLGVAFAATASAQPGWMPQPAGRAVALDFLRPLDLPLFDGFDEQGRYLGERQLGSLSSALALSARVPLGPSLSLDAQLPVAVASSTASTFTIEDETTSDTEIGLGNPYVGVSWTPRAGDTEVTLDGGIRLPLAAGGLTPEGDAATVWILAAPEQREAFIADLASVRAAVHVRQRAGPVVLDARLAPVLGIAAKEYEISLGPREPAECIRPVYLTVGYGLLATVRAGRVEIAGGLVGSERVDSVDEYFYPDTSALVASAALAGPVRPRLNVRYGFGEFARTSVGLGVAVRL